MVAKPCQWSTGAGLRRKPAWHDMDCISLASFAHPHTKRVGTAESRTAMAELRKLGPSVEVERRRAALKAGRRLQTLLAELDEPMVATAALRQLRAVEVRERIATPEARQWLKELAGGVPRHA
jgi:hypothetical protein